MCFASEVLLLFLTVTIEEDIKIFNLSAQIEEYILFRNVDLWMCRVCVYLCMVLFSFRVNVLDSWTRVYSEFRDTGNKYKMRIRSRVSNLGDLKNPTLRQSVISGHVTPSRIAVMSSEVSKVLMSSSSH